ncbi:hypothetical protein DDB_G0272272 [Dictyostelium discoideum AX4]|uniref:Uncharacterized protein n=1 Tax=Dictyostelium discoideum TaxID=44689 RepID=Q559Y3_DICDI|nr:hypothetical protein DDB_G0272272 [Dictyostelium discoideum AX4]EAL71288.1 hypothetical protein DDB_G0272272 [Dictyostelium discoideum AX4]|eukprot:XP_645201.1 hypothetical protein DDB_G0272272 [Dictyostelium discoideum AX4]
MLGAFINIQPNRLIEIHTKTYKFINNTNNTNNNNNNKTTHYKFEFSFQHLDIIDKTNPNLENNTYNIDRIIYKPETALYNFFNYFKFYYKIFISFTITLFVSIIFSFFLPNSSTLNFNSNNNNNNNIQKQQNSRELNEFSINYNDNKLNYKLIIYFIIILNFIPILVSMILMICLDFKKALISDVNYYEILKILCIDDNGSRFGYCSNSNFITQDIIKRSISNEILKQHTINIDSITYQHDSFWWRDSSTFIRITISFILVIILLSGLIITIYTNLIDDLKNQYKINELLKLKNNQNKSDDSNNNNNQANSIEMKDFNKTIEISKKQSTPNSPSTPFGKQSIYPSLSSMGSFDQSYSSGCGSSASGNSSSKNIATCSNNSIQSLISDHSQSQLPTSPNTSTSSI